MNHPPTYRKLVATKHTPHFREAAVLVEEPFPEPAADEIVVRNHYAGVNATDVNISAGRYDANRTLPLDLGAEAAGEVVVVGADVTTPRVGDFVVTGNFGGGYREYNVVKARQAVPVPAATPEALSLMVSGLTASIALEVTGGMTTGEKVLVTAAAGGTGQYAVQLARMAGNHVIGTCGTPEKAALLRALGCHRVINYREENVKQVLRREYAEGIDLIYESVGGHLFDTCVRSLAVHGRLLCIGFIGEYVGGVEEVRQPRIYTQILARSASIRGFFLPHFGRYYRAHMEKLFGLLAAGTLRVTIDPRVFHGLEAVPDAVEYLHGGQSRGKVVVRLI